MREDIFITIFTPTYNRGYIIENLYKSLLKQTLKNFEWLIIDDGSTDNTKEIVDWFIKENKIDIKYIYKENAGKYKAINDGIEKAKGELFFIVDSDDELKSNSIELVKKYYNQIKRKKDFIGVVGLRGDKEDNIYTGYLNEEKSVNKYYQLEYLDTTYIKYRNKYNISGDRAEVCITQKLKSFKFPENDEKFMSEGYLWNEISKAGYKFRYFNKIIYISEYLNDGLSNNINDTLKNSPRNTAILKNQIVGIKEISILKRLKECVNYYRYGSLYEKNLKKLYSGCNNKILSILAIPIAKIYSIK